MKPTLLPNDKGLCAISVPYDSTGHNILCRCLHYSHLEQYKSVEIDPFLNFEILGFCTRDEISFDVAECVEDTIDLPEYKYGGEMHPKETYWDYELKSYRIDNCDDSFRSLLSAAGLHFENNGKEPECGFTEANLIEKLVIIREI